MKKTLLFIIAIVVLIALWAMSAYNGMIGVQENATQAAADVQSAYQRRADLIPNLVETVKGYAQHEENTLKEVIEARTRATSITIDPSNMTAEQMKEFQKSWDDLNTSLGRLIAVAESYPDLKASENFRDLHNQLEGSENRINEARNKYNAAVTEYNKNIRSFPNNIFAGIFGFKTMEKFAAESGAEKAPKVQF